jgi:hypothetical protein
VHQRSPLSIRRLRAASLLIALLSAVMLGGVQEAACAMHGLGAAQKGHAAMAGSTVAANDAAAASHQAGGHSHDMGGTGCDCSCIGACTMVAPLATPPAVATLRIALIEPEPRRPLDIEPAHAPTAEPDRLLPFANGPPVSALI